MSVELLISNCQSLKKKKWESRLKLIEFQSSRKKSSPDKALSVLWVRPPQREHDK